MSTVKILDKAFKVSIPAETIQKRIDELAAQLNKDLDKEDVIFLGILNGSFMFAADLFKKITIPCRISFLKLASYQGSSSSGQIKQLIGLNENLKDKTVVILEDIVDTGLTIEVIIKQLNGYDPKAIHTATLLYKPEASVTGVIPDYTGFEIPNDFVVGYGLDYDGYGRNYEDIYTLSDHIDNN